MAGVDLSLSVCGLRFYVFLQMVVVGNDDHESAEFNFFFISNKLRFIVFIPHLSKLNRDFSQANSFIVQGETYDL